MTDFTGYLTTETYPLPYNSGGAFRPGTNPPANTQQEDLKKEIRALKGLVLNRCLPRFPYLFHHELIKTDGRSRFPALHLLLSYRLFSFLLGLPLPRPRTFHHHHHHNSAAISYHIRLIDSCRNVMSIHCPIENVHGCIQYVRKPIQRGIISVHKLRVK